MTELDHLPRHEIGDVDPDVPLRQLRRFCDRRRYLRDERVLDLGGAAAADLSVHKNLMALQWTPADEVAIWCDLRENDLRKVGRSARCLAVDAGDFGGNLCSLGAVQGSFDASDGVGRHGGFLSKRQRGSAARRRDAHECFAEVAAFQHADERGWRILKAVGDVLAIADAASATAAPTVRRNAAKCSAANS